MSEPNISEILREIADNIEKEVKSAGRHRFPETRHGVTLEIIAKAIRAALPEEKP